jgi:hypothetical protein
MKKKTLFRDDQNTTYVYVLYLTCIWREIKLRLFLKINRVCFLLKLKLIYLLTSTFGEVNFK